MSLITTLFLYMSIDNLADGDFIIWKLSKVKLCLIVHSQEILSLIWILYFSQRCKVIFPKWNSNWSKARNENKKSKKMTSVLLPLMKTYALLYLSSSFIQLLTVLFTQVTPQVFHSSLRINKSIVWLPFASFIPFISIQRFVCFFSNSTTSIKEIHSSTTVYIVSIF
jgi:hypothetical protein